MTIAWDSLTNPIDRRELSAFVQRQPRIQRSSYKSWFEISWVATMCLAVVTLIFSVAVDDAEDASRAALLQTVSVAVVLLMVTWTVLRRRTRFQDSFRLARFAAAHGFTYTFEREAPSFPATGFDNGRGGTIHDVIALESPHELEIGSYQALVGSGDSTHTRTWKYARIRLGSPLPHFVLDAKANGSTLQEDFARGQKLSLGGDLDRHFTLYCPVGYDEDARRLFTPEVTRHLTDELRSWDIEIVDDQLFLFSDASAVQNLAALRGLLEGATALQRAVLQWESWRDSRLPAARMSPSAPATNDVFATPSVAPEGRRLRTRLGWGVWLMLAVAAAGIVLSILKALGVPGF